jgi:hypothetical protein
MKKSTIILIIVLLGLWAVVFFHKQEIDKHEARLDKLEAARTSAQQPQERNSFDSLLIRANNMWIRDSIIYEKEIEFWKHHKIVICK